MTETFKSGQHRICAGCLGSIAPRDRVCVLYDEIHCLDCLTDSEEQTMDLLGLGDDIDNIIEEQ